MSLDLATAQTAPSLWQSKRLRALRVWLRRRYLRWLRQPSPVIDKMGSQHIAFRL